MKASVNTTIKQRQQQLIVTLKKRPKGGIWHNKVSLCFKTPMTWITTPNNFKKCPSNSSWQLAQNCSVCQFVMWMCHKRNNMLASSLMGSFACIQSMYRNSLILTDHLRSSNSSPGGREHLLNFNVIHSVSVGTRVPTDAAALQRELELLRMQ